MTSKTEELKLELEALKYAASMGYPSSMLKDMFAPFTIKRDVALAQPEQEPVAFSCLRCATPKKCAVHGCSPNTWPSESSPKRPWVGLTDAPTYTEQQIANACWAAEISDSKCESLLIALQESAHNIGVNT